MTTKRGFTLIEVLISLSIFSYIFSSLIILFFQFSRGVQNVNNCSPFSILVIQKILTESDIVEVSKISKEVLFDHETLYTEENILYLFKNIEKDNFQKNKPDFQLDSCDIIFSKNLTSTSSLLNQSKCLNFQYKNGAAQTICALK